jgi:hypothetical protein
MDDACDGEWRFGELLSDLKSRGCTVLVTGHASEDAFRRLSANFLGGRGARRSRVFGLLDHGVDAARSRLQRAGPGYDPALVIDATSGVSRAAAASQPGLSDRSVAVRRSDHSLSSLETEIIDAIHDSRQLNGPFESGELRVCVDSLRPLAERHDDDSLYEFLSAVDAAIKSVDGMGHFVFPGDRDDDVVQSLVPAFDVLVELRDENEYVEQRWTFRDYDVPSLWMSL